MLLFPFQNLTNNKRLKDFYNILTTNIHSNVDFISTMEGNYLNSGQN